MEELKTYRLADICNSIQTGPFGSQLHKSDYVEFGTPIVMPKDITNGKINDNNISRISKNDVARLFKHKLVPGNIIYPRRGDISKCALITSKEDGWVCGTGCIKVDINQQIANSTYVMYVLCQSETVNWIESNAVGTTMLNLNTSILSDLPIKLPSLNTQKKLANIVSSFDKKIALNRRINDNLEQQAQALFKSWFVDFEPFKDGKFVDSEMGMIPEGWKVGKLEDIADVVGGGTPSKANALYFDKQCIPWITPKDLSIKKTKFISKGEIDITEEGYKNSSAKKIPLGSVLFSSRAPIGYISIAENELTTNQGFKSVVPVKAGTSFLYLYLKANTKAIEAQATGSTFKEASGSLIKSLCVIIPPDTVFDSFERNAFPFFSAQANVEREIVNLSKARDTLLPRLMSGELKINDLNC